MSSEMLWHKRSDYFPCGLLFSMAALVLYHGHPALLTEPVRKPVSWRGSDMLINHNSEYLTGSASLPTSPVSPIAPSSTVASRLARSFSDSQAEKGTSGEYESDQA